MSTQVQYRRGTATQNNAFVGALGEIIVDTTNWTLRVHDGITAGGAGNLATVAYVDAKTFIVNGTSNVNVVTSGGNVTVGVGGTSNVAVVASTGLFVTGLTSVTGNITGGNLSGTNIVGTLTTAAQTNITSVGTLSSLSVSGNVQGGNLNTAGVVSATGAITGASLSVSTGNITGGNLILTGAITDLNQLDIQTSANNANIVLTPNGTGNVNIGRMSASGTVTAANFLTSGLISATGAITGAAITGTSLTVSTGSVTCGSIVNANANGVGNIGSSSLYFNTVFAKATSAQYADVAEKYRADADYPVGTVLIFGGDQEVTASQQSHSSAIAGTISENPAYIMNNGLAGLHVAVVALLGRIPCRVIGNISKGDLLVSSEVPGVATKLDPTKYQPGVVIGKALKHYNSDSEGVIEIVVGRM